MKTPTAHRRDHSRQLSRLALLGGGLPLVTIHLCYLIAANAGDVPWCLPYGIDCVSISACGREGLQYSVFKALMIPTAVIFGWFWLRCNAWLDCFNVDRSARRMIMTVMGLIAAAGLIFYTLALGAIGDEYRVVRRTGVICFFGFTYLAQLQLISVIKNHQPLRQQLGGYFNTMRSIGVVLLALIIASVSLSAWDSQFYDRIENAFEWTVTVLLCGVVLLFGLALRQVDNHTTDLTKAS